MECKNEREEKIFEEGIKEGKSQMKKEIAYHMHEMGDANWHIAEILGESKYTIEKWIYEADWKRGQEAGMQLMMKVARMLLREKRYDDLGRLEDEEFRDRIIQECKEKEKKKKQEETGTSEPR